MIAWWVAGGMVSMMVVGAVLYKGWRHRRRVASGSHTVMTKTTDGELLQFLVRPTRRGGREL
ncbi:MAG: hypothetical protein AB7P24_13965 [Nitrospira sp.]|nr:hypothetical protein [Nitrospira sp. WS238]